MGRLFNFDSKGVEKEFLDELCNTIEINNEAYKSSATYKPSSLKCLREMFFIMKRVDVPEEREDYTFIGICESGTDRHKRLQEIISKMKNFEYVDVERYIKDNNLSHLQIIRKFGYEILLHNKKYNMNLMTDGILKYKNNYYLLEIKTEGSGKFYERTGVNVEHYNQAICYSICFDIDKVIFLYENRDILDKKAYLFTVTREMKNKVINMINRCNNYLEMDTIPPKPIEYGAKFCQYCKYKKVCKGV